MCHPLLFLSFLKVNPHGDKKKGSSSRGQTAGPKEPVGDGRSEGATLSPLLSPQTLLGSIPWHLGIWNLSATLRCSILNWKAGIEVRIFFVGDQSPYGVQV